LALTNFGGIRTSLPAGDITISDVISVFPFENKIVILEIQGKYIRGIIENFANKQRVEAMSGIKLIIKNRKIKKLLIGGKPLNDNKLYNLATIDFLLGGGDGLYLLKKRERVINTDILIRDAVIQYIQELTDKGEIINPKKDGRVIIIKSKE
jgi:5''-nucleotidase/2'',3''-cyclic phosphodiesterase and related esterases